ncbi:glycosyltransferase [Sphingomonas silueang]|uniref:glycosyltransferase n=1 Tax=Sphingomonas silueang TaxID=3156617 RepID=UPI0032B34D0D
MSGAIWFCVTHSAAGGLREIWNDVSEGLAARGHRVGRVALYPPRAGLEAPGDDGLAWDHVLDRTPASAADMPRLLAALVRWLRRHRPAAIVTAMPLANVLLPIAVTLARTGTRVIPSHHSPTDTHNPRIDRIDGWTGCLPCVAAVVSVSDAVAATLAHKPAAYRAKRRTIHNALPTRIEARIDATERTGGGGRHIVALGRLTAQKNYPQLLRALALVPDATLAIVGGGEDAAMLHALAGELGIAGRVRFTGQVTRGAALAEAAAADLFVQVSLYEGHSLALIEAARLGLPLIVSDVAVQVEGITLDDGTRCGAVVPLGDPPALAAAIRDVLDDPALRAARTAQARRLAGGASNAAMIDAYESLLAATLAAR